MSKVEAFLKAVIKDRAKITNASKGTDFEEVLKSKLKLNGISEIVLATADNDVKKYLQSIKPVIQSKTGDTLINNGLILINEGYADSFIWQPYGSQNYPDFLIFTQSKVFSIESKYTTKGTKKPVWNGNLPKKDGIYIFGSYQLKDITMFRGNDILDEKERKNIISIWDKLDISFTEWENNYKKELSQGNMTGAYGFAPYIRQAYSQGQKYNPKATINFFTNPKRKDIEKQLIQFVRDNDK